MANGPDGRWERGWRLARATGIVAVLVLFLAMPDKTVALLSAVARLVIGLFLVKLAFDHGPEIKALLKGVTEGRLSFKGLGFEVQQATELAEAEREAERLEARLPASDDQEEYARPASVSGRVGEER